MVASAKLGQKLLQGWTMLGDTCPTCSVPFMRSRDGTQTVCVICEEDKKPSINSRSISITSVTKPSITETRSPKDGSNNSSSSIMTANIINLLNSSLRDSSDLETFVQILESSLPLIKLINPLKEYLNEVKSTIEARLQINFQSNNHLAVINYFKLMTRLLEASNELQNY